MIEDLPTRKVPRKGVSVSGRYSTPLYTAPCRADYRFLNLEYESLIEKNHLTMLEFQPIVRRLWTQKTFQIGSLKYTADIIAEIQSYGSYPCPLIVIECKPYDDLKKNFVKHAKKFRRIKAWTAERGLIFKVLTERSLSIRHVQNIRHFNQYLWRPMTCTEKDLITSLFAERNIWSRNELVAHCFDNKLDVPAVDTALDKAIAQKLVLVDFAKPITDDTPLKWLTDLPEWRHPYREDSYIRMLLANASALSSVVLTNDLVRF